LGTLALPVLTSETLFSASLKCFQCMALNSLLETTFLICPSGLKTFTL